MANGWWWRRPSSRPDALAPRAPIPPNRGIGCARGDRHEAVALDGGGDAAGDVPRGGLGPAGAHHRGGDPGAGARDRRAVRQVPGRDADARAGLRHRRERQAGARPRLRRAGAGREAAGDRRHAVPHRIDDQGVHRACRSCRCATQASFRSTIRRRNMCRSSRAGTIPRPTARRSACATCSTMSRGWSPTIPGATARRRCPMPTSPGCWPKACRSSARRRPRWNIRTSAMRCSGGSSPMSRACPIGAMSSGRS